MHGRGGGTVFSERFGDFDKVEPVFARAGAWQPLRGEAPGMVPRTHGWPD